MCYTRPSYMFSKGDLVSLRQEYICRRTTEFGDSALQANQPFLHQPSARDVVRMAVGVYCQRFRVLGFTIESDNNFILSYTA